MRYRVQRGFVQVTARAAAEAGAVKFEKLDGTIEFDPDDPRSARAELRLDLLVHDTGDRLQNWKIGGDLEALGEPTVTWNLMRLEAREPTAAHWSGSAIGQLRWRSFAATVTIRGEAAVNPRRIDARGSFDVPIRALGIPAAKFFVSEDPAGTLTVQVSVVAWATGR